MKIKISEDTQRILLLLKLDAKRLFERIKFRVSEYMFEFSLKRSRDQFKEIFTNRYDEVSIKSLMYCGQEVIVGLDQFYSKVDEMRWYLNHTQDMPKRVEDNVLAHIRELEKHFETLNLYIDVEMGLIRETSLEEKSINTNKNEETDN